MTSFGSYLDNLDLNEFEGMILDKPLDEIPNHIAKIKDSARGFELWEYQAFDHHHHLTNWEEASFKSELEIVKELEKYLLTKFPHYGFVIELMPRFQITWYQSTPSSPIEQFGKYELYQTPKRITKVEMEAVANQHGGMNSTEGREAAKLWLQNRPFRKGDEGPCEHCHTSSEFSIPYQSEVHSGLLLSRCKGCDSEVIHSTRIVRFFLPSTT